MRKKLTFNCFSPPVMLATFVVEIACAIYVWQRYRSNNLQRLSIVVLMLLAVFQIAEYNVCGRFGIESGAWSRIGYAAITMLPPLGLHITFALANRKPNWLVWLGYASGIAFASLFVFGSVFQGYACGGNYVIFQLKPMLGGLYFVYYYWWLFAAVFLAHLFVSKKLPKYRKRALISHVIGYALFMIPTSVAIILFPESADALPSVMCGFAVLYALVLTFAVLPVAIRQRKLATKK